MVFVDSNHLQRVSHLLNRASILCNFFDKLTTMLKISTRTRVILLLVLFNYTAHSQIAYQTIVATGLNNPIDIAIPPNASPANGSTRIFVAQQNGLIRLWNGISFSDLVDLSTVITTAGSEQGLLSMTFHPLYDGVTNRDFFVYYTRNSDGALIAARYRTHASDPNAIDPAGGTVLITPIAHPTFSNHNGGDLNFGPDGFLYLTTGDGGGGGDPFENAQNPSSLLGKLLKIDVNGIIPVTPTVVDIGLRNPFRWSFDKTTGDAWIGDVGQGSWEEISFKPAGSSGLNFGWDCYEGNAPYELTGCPDASTITFPSHAYPNSDGQSVVGGFVYRGTEFAALQVWYIATDYFSGLIFRRSTDGTWFTQTGGQAGISSYGQAPDGTLYAISQFSDDLYKVIVTGPLPVKLVSFSGRRDADISELSWKTTEEQNTARFKIEFSNTATYFQTAGIVVASRNPNGNDYSFQHRFNSNSDLFYRLVIEEDNGQVAYSSIIRLSSGKNKIKIYPTIINNGILNIQTEKPLYKLHILNAGGSMLFQKEWNAFTGTTAISLPPFPKGIYIVQLHMETEIKREKIIIQ